MTQHNEGQRKHSKSGD